MTSVNILGTDYTIEYRTKEQDVRLKQVDGYCDYSSRELYVLKEQQKIKTIWTWQT